MANILELKHITKIYKEAQSEICVLKDISFSVQEGQFVVFIGPSGSGKTTLLNLIALLDKTSEGEIIFRGKDITKLKENNAAKMRLLDMGFVFQFDALLPEFTVLENVLLPAAISGKKAKTRAKYLLEKFGIWQLASKFPPSLSGGEKQRAALARALINNPSILLADEPTDSVDAERTEEIIKIFRGLANEGKTILIASHDSEALKLCDQKIKIQ